MAEVLGLRALLGPWRYPVGVCVGGRGRGVEGEMGGRGTEDRLGTRLMEEAAEARLSAEAPVLIWVTTASPVVFWSS